MEILAKEKYQEFEDFAQQTWHKNGNFTQSLEWIDLKANWGHEIVVSRNENGEIVGAMLILMQKLPVFGWNLLYSPHGPVCDYHNKAVMKDLLDGAKEVAKLHRGFMIKVDPCVRETDEETIREFTDLGYTYEPGKKDFETIQVRFNYGLTDIYGKTEEEVLMSFTQKTRYNIRVAMKHGVECKICDKSYLPEFYRLMKVTAVRDNFIPRPLSYFEKMMDVFGDKLRLYMCFYEGVAVSGAICVQMAGKTWYVFGASDNQYRNVMPNYLMQWSMIKWAIEGNCFLYDFLGIPVNADPNSPMIGVYRFKKGFNGEILGYVGEFDYVTNKFYTWVFNTANSARHTYYSIIGWLRAKKNHTGAAKKPAKSDESKENKPAEEK